MKQQSPIPPSTRRNPSTESAVSPHAPGELADFEFLKLIGEGTFGAVWLVKERVTGVYRAAKVFPRTSDDTEISGLCEYQRRALSHPNLVQVYLVGQHDTAYHVIMELADDIKGPVPMDPQYYEPCSLDRLLHDRGALPVDSALKHLQGVLEGVAYLHAQGLIHRDIKPSNVLFCTGQVKLCDFGLVAPGHQAIDRAGTHGYWRPDGPTDRESDLYALTKVAYQMLTGSDVASFPDLPAELARTTSTKTYRAVRDLLERGCSSNPARRFASAQAMRSRLTRIQRPSGRDPGKDRTPTSLVTKLTRPLILVLLATLLFAGWWNLRNTAAAAFKPLVEFELRTFPEGKGNPNTSAVTPGERERYVHVISTNNPKAPDEVVRWAHLHMVSRPASYIQVFWIPSGGYVTVNPQQAEAQKHFHEPELESQFRRLDGTDSNYVICALLHDRPFRNSSLLREQIQELTSRYRDDHPGRAPLPRGRIRVLNNSQITEYDHPDIELEDPAGGDLGMLGEIWDRFGATYYIVGVELGLPAERRPQESTGQEPPVEKSEESAGGHGGS